MKRKTLFRASVALAACAALVGGFFLSTSVFGGGNVPLDSQYPRPISPKPSEYLHLGPNDSGFKEFPSSFSDFTLYWVGEEFSGHTLRSIVRNVFSPEDGSPTENSVMFLYGRCGAEKLTEGGCPFPLSIIIQPYCLVPPARVAQAPDLSAARKVRGGADAATVGGGLRIWTGEITVKLYAETPELLEEATRAMVSPNGLGAVDALAPLPAPSVECGGYEWVAY